MGGPSSNPRLRRERRTIAAMFLIFCQHHHGAGRALCAQCQQDLDYCFRRIDKCPYGENKPTCKNCVTHCYSAAMQERVRQIMRFAGPRMLARHPVLTLWHFWDDRRPPPKAGG